MILTASAVGKVGYASIFGKRNYEISRKGRNAPLSAFQICRYNIEMNKNRVKQFIYGGIFLAIIILIFIGIYFIYFRSVATCFDNKQNGNENGLDCGGGCTSCEIKYAKDLKLSWVKSFSATGSSSILIAEIKNQNANYGVSEFSYNLDIYDKSVKKIKTVSDRSFIYAGDTKYLVQLVDFNYQNYGSAKMEFSGPVFVSREQFFKPQINTKEFKTDIYDPDEIKVPFYTFTRDLSLGINGDDVGYLQDFLRGMNFYTASTTGSFDNSTKQALIKYQKENKLYPSIGALNETTRQYINSQIELIKNKVPLTGQIFPVSVIGIVKNNDVISVSKVIITAMLFDNNGLIIGASKTELENMSPTDEKTFKIVFPKNIDIKLINSNLTKVYVDAIR